MKCGQGQRSCGKPGCGANAERRHRNETDNKMGQAYEGATTLRTMELFDAKRTIENKDVLIRMLQEQLKKIEDRYRRNLNETERIRFKYCVVNDRLDQMRCRKAGSRCGNVQQEMEQWKEHCEQCMRAKQRESFVPELKEKIASFEKIINEHYSTLIGLVEKISSGDTKYNECPNEYPAPQIHMLQQELQMLNYENGMLRQELEIMRRAIKPVEVVYENRKMMNEASDGIIFQSGQPSEMGSESAFSASEAESRYEPPDSTADPGEIGESEEYSKESSVQVSTFSVTENRSDSDHDTSQKSTSSESEGERKFSRKVSLKRDQKAASRNESAGSRSCSTVRTSLVPKHRATSVDVSTQYENALAIPTSEQVENKRNCSEQCTSTMYTNESTQHEEVVQNNQIYDDGGKDGEVASDTSECVDKPTSNGEDEQHNSPIQRNLPIEDEKKDSEGPNTESKDCDCKKNPSVPVKDEANKRDIESVDKPISNREEVREEEEQIPKNEAEHTKRSSVKSETRSVQSEGAVIQSNLPVTDERKVSKSSGVESMDSDHKEVSNVSVEDEANEQAENRKRSSVKSETRSTQSGEVVIQSDLPVTDERKVSKSSGVESMDSDHKDVSNVSAEDEANEQAENRKSSSVESETRSVQSEKGVSQSNLPVTDESKTSKSSGAKSTDSDHEEDTNVSVEDEPNEQAEKRKSSSVKSEPRSMQSEKAVNTCCRRSVEKSMDSDHTEVSNVSVEDESNEQAEKRKSSSVKSEARSMQSEKAVNTCCKRSGEKSMGSDHTEASNVSVEDEANEQAENRRSSSVKSEPRSMQSEKSIITCCKSSGEKSMDSDRTEVSNMSVEDEVEDQDDESMDDIVYTGDEANVLKRQDTETAVALKQIIMNLNDLRGELDCFKEVVRRIEDRSAYCVTEVARFREEWKSTTNRPGEKPKTGEAEYKESSAASFNVYKSAPARDSSSDSQVTVTMSEDLEAKKMKKKGRKTKSVSLTLKDGRVMSFNETKKRPQSYDTTLDKKFWFDEALVEPSTARKTEANEITQLISELKHQEHDFSPADPPTDLISYRSDQQSMSSRKSVSIISEDSRRVSYKAAQQGPSPPPSAVSPPIVHEQSEDAVSGSITSEHVIPIFSIDAVEQTPRQDWPFYKSISEQISSQTSGSIFSEPVAQISHTQPEHSGLAHSSGQAPLSSVRKLEILRQHYTNLQKERKEKDQQIKTVEELLHCYVEEEGKKTPDDNQVASETADNYLQFYINKVIHENGKLKSTIESLLTNVKTQVDQLNTSKRSCQVCQQTSRSIISGEARNSKQTSASNVNKQCVKRECFEAKGKQKKGSSEDPKGERLEIFAACLICSSNEICLGHASTSQTLEVSSEDNESSGAILGKNANGKIRCEECDVDRDTLVRSLENYIQDLIDQLDVSKKIEDDIVHLKGTVSAKQR